MTFRVVCRLGLPCDVKNAGKALCRSGDVPLLLNKVLQMLAPTLTVGVAHCQRFATEANGQAEPVH